METHDAQEDLASLKRELVLANRILAHEGVLDAYGHVSARHPHRQNRFLLSRSRSPWLVELDDILEFNLDGTPIEQSSSALYVERPIHTAIYRARQDVRAVVHHHAHEVIPFTVTETPLRPVLHVAARIGSEIPVWDIADRFGETDLLVRTAEQGDDLAQRLGTGRVVLMRGHGAAVAGASLREAVLISVFLVVNARVQAAAMRLGSVKFLSEGEVQKSGDTSMSSVSLDRLWGYWKSRCGGA
jgi:HCOMODA/2-hydroxy-3-carboxy-muconic semialdehyde decarboxylase